MTFFLYEHGPLAETAVKSGDSLILLFRILRRSASDAGSRLLDGLALSASDTAALRAAEQALVEAFEAPERTAWVYCYTEDAIFVAPGRQAIEGRAALLEAAREMVLSSAEMIVESTLGDGDLAATLGHASWVSGPRGSGGPTSRVRFLIVWRRESDGRWRIARELLNEAL